MKITGHAIEARLCAEDPADGFKPQTGTGVLQRPAATSRRRPAPTRVADITGALRLDARASSSPRAESRDAALQRSTPGACAASRAAACAPTDNFLIDILDDPDFRKATPRHRLARRAAPRSTDEHIDEPPGNIAAPYFARPATARLALDRRRPHHRQSCVNATTTETLRGRKRSSIGATHASPKCYAQHQDMGRRSTVERQQGHLRRPTSDGTRIHVSLTTSPRRPLRRHHLRPRRTQRRQPAPTSSARRWPAASSR